jgi:hypothetical protein
MDEHATITLSRDAVAAVLDSASGQGFAPPATLADGRTSDVPAEIAAPAPPRTPPSSAPPPVEDVEIVEWEAPGDVHGERCGFCGGTLPSGRAVNFCPHCGQSLRVLHCPGCNEEVELGWRHCVACGAALPQQ